MLISDARMQALRRVANKSLINNVTLCPRTITTDAYGGDPKATYPAGTTTVGWLLMTNTPVIEPRSGIATSVGVFRLNLPATIEGINVGDQVDVGGRRYMVQDTNEDDSYRVFTTVTLRKLDSREF